MILSDLVEHLRTSKDTMGLKDLHDIHQEIKRAIFIIELETTSVLSIYQQLNQLHDDVMKRALLLAEQDITKGSRPKKLCWVQFGSGARGEQTIKTDQDHGLLYQLSDEDSAACIPYVLSLSKLGTTYLHKVGYPYCSGNVMAINERWSKDAHSWLDDMTAYMKKCEPDDITYLLIATDLKGLYGEKEWVREIKDSLFSSFQTSPSLLKRLHQHLKNPKIAIGLFGNLLVEQYGEHSGKFNVKNGFYIPMVNAIKFLAITQGITSSTTLDRLNALKETDMIPSSHLKDIFEASLYFRLRASLTENRDEKDYLNLATLSKEEKQLLHVRLKQAKTFLHQLLRRQD